MKFGHYFGAILSLAVVILASPLQQRSTTAFNTSAPSVGAVFFLSNQPEENYIISNAIGADGTLTYGRAISAGGQGQHANSTGADALFSQGSIQVSGNRVFAVNPGSNTVVMFEINEKDPTRLTMIGKPVSSGGEFPMSVAVSEQTNQVCVLNGGRLNGVNCYKQDPVLGLVPIKNTQRSLNLELQTPPTGPANSLSQVMFNEDGSLLLAAVKGSTADPGFLASWEVDRRTGALSENFIRSTPAPGGALPFGMTVIPGTNAVVVTDPDSGFEVFNFSDLTSAGAPSTVTAVDGQEAICWVVYSYKIGNYYMTDGKTGLVTEVHINSELQSSIVKQYFLGDNTTLLDDGIATINGHDFLYVLAVGTKSISVMSLEKAGGAVPLQQFSFEDQMQSSVSGGVDFDDVHGLAVYVRQ